MLCVRTPNCTRFKYLPVTCMHTIWPQFARASRAEAVTQFGLIFYTALAKLFAPTSRSRTGQAMEPLKQHPGEIAGVQGFEPCQIMKACTTMHPDKAAGSPVP